MSTDVSITVEYLPADQREADRIVAALERLAKRFDLRKPDVSVWIASDRGFGRVYLASHGRENTATRLDALARVVSRLIPGDTRVEVEGRYDGYEWAETATYRAGRKVRVGTKKWVEADVQEV